MEMDKAGYSDYLGGDGSGGGGGGGGGGANRVGKDLSCSKRIIHHMILTIAIAFLIFLMPTEAGKVPTGTVKGKKRMLISKGKVKKEC